MTDESLHNVDVMTDAGDTVATAFTRYTAAPSSGSSWKSKYVFPITIYPLYILTLIQADATFQKEAGTQEGEERYGRRGRIYLRICCETSGAIGLPEKYGFYLLQYCFILMLHFIPAECKKLLPHLVTLPMPDDEKTESLALQEELLSFESELSDVVEKTWKEDDEVLEEQDARQILEDERRLKMPKKPSIAKGDWVVTLLDLFRV
jgi:hypothetical protein